MLEFGQLLERGGIDQSQTLLVRHTPIENALRRVMPWIVAERPDLWLAYQRIQWATLEKAMTRAQFLVSLVGLEPRKATYASFYRIGDWEELDYQGYCAFPGNAELEALGMSGRTPDMGSCLAFDLQALDTFDEYFGRLAIDWPEPAQNWYRWAANGRFPIDTIVSESVFVSAMPDWRELIVSWHELANLPRSWQTVMAQWRGVYFIHDSSSGRGYVGSAYGSDNILGRWLGYARTGHGGNAGLRKVDPAGLSFSILQLTSPDLDPEEVIAFEESWKRRLHTRSAGLNRN